MIIVQTSDGFFEVWRNGRRISGEHPFVSRQMAQGWIAQVDRSPEGQDAAERLDAQHESAVVADDAPITGMSDQEGA